VSMLDSFSYPHLDSLSDQRSSLLGCMPPQPWSKTTAGKGPLLSGFVSLPVKFKEPSMMSAAVPLNETVLGTSGLLPIIGASVCAHEAKIKAEQARMKIVDRDAITFMIIPHPQNMPVSSSSSASSSSSRSALGLTRS